MSINPPQKVNLAVEHEQQTQPAHQPEAITDIAGEVIEIAGRQTVYLDSAESLKERLVQLEEANSSARAFNEAMEDVQKRLVYEAKKTQVFVGHDGRLLRYHR
jgi:type III secretion system FlhB-like substrate exporter